jgi:hypothetical protein
LISTASVCSGSTPTDWGEQVTSADAADAKAVVSVGTSNASAPGSDEVPTKRAEYGTICRDFADPVDGSPPPARPDLLQSQQP